MDARLSNPRHDGHGYKIIGCRLGNTRSRGIIVKSDDGIIRDNVITHCGLALRIGPEWPDEADYSQHVVVEGNTLAENGDGIVVDGSGAEQNRGITIRNNRLLSNTGGDVRVAWADGVTITGNTFSRACLTGLWASSRSRRSPCPGRAKRPHQRQPHQDARRLRPALGQCRGERPAVDAGCRGVR